MESVTNQSKYARATARVMPTHADGQAGGGSGGATAKPSPKLVELAGEDVDDVADDLLAEEGDDDQSDDEAAAVAGRRTWRRLPR